MMIATLADIERIAELREQAAEHFREAIQLIWPQRQPRHTAAILAGYAALAADEGEMTLAARLAGAADQLVRADGVVLPAYSRGGYTTLLERLQSDMKAEALQDELECGRSWTADQAREAAEESIAARRTQSTRSVESRATHLLSAREIEVLRLVVEGKTDAEIAETLFISRSTAGDHVSSILNKLDVPNRVAAAVFAIRAQLV